jgi:hypothetical protein
VVQPVSPDPVTPGEPAVVDAWPELTTGPKLDEFACIEVPVPFGLDEVDDAPLPDPSTRHLSGTIQELEMENVVLPNRRVPDLADIV